MLIASTALARELSALESSNVKAASDGVAAAALNKPQHHHAISGKPAQGGYELDGSPIERLREPTHRDAPAP